MLKEDKRSQTQTSLILRIANMQTSTDLNYLRKPQMIALIKPVSNEIDKLAFKKSKLKCSGSIEIDDESLNETFHIIKL